MHLGHLSIVSKPAGHWDDFQQHVMQIVSCCWHCSSLVLSSSKCPCQSAFFCIGEVQADANDVGDDNGNAANLHNRKELLCGGCTAHQTGANCKQHGAEFVEWKCRFCCSIASFFCFGTTHMCAPCHAKWQECPGFASGGRKTCTPMTCPLQTEHPNHGNEHCLGCAICRRQE